MNEREVRDLTWDYCGIIRDRAGLEKTLHHLESSHWRAVTPTLATIELRNIHQVAQLIAHCALWREESRGAHYRTDFPAPRKEYARPSSVSRAHTAAFHV